MEINKVVSIEIDVDDWDKYIGYMAHDYRDVWINHYDLEQNNEYHDCNFNCLLEKHQESKKLLLDGLIDYIIFRCDID